MERLRATDGRAKGIAPFSIGLWVGNEVTPGTSGEARDALNRLQKAVRPEEANGFQVESCPWCLTPMVPKLKSDKPQDYGMRLVGPDVILHCVDECEFAAELPLAVVGEVLYEEPPTVLLATVDKFARLQFKPEAGRLLGLGTTFNQPSMIIQDELHLLSGPLGTTVVVFDAVIQLLLSRSGASPKIVASTATIRASEEQVGGLYGRQFALYPPSGLDDDRTFFSHPVENGEGRRLMSQSVSQPSAVIAAVTPMVEMPEALTARVPSVAPRDAYWSLVMYHNSLRELGCTGTLVVDDVNGRLESRAGRLGFPLRPARAGKVLELTSRRGAEELPNDLRALRIRADESSEAVDVILSSNMLSVGIDIPRLALMLMVGQPKTTAEYIRGHVFFEKVVTDNGGPLAEQVAEWIADDLGAAPETVLAVAAGEETTADEMLLDLKDGEWAAFLKMLDAGRDGSGSDFVVDGRSLEDVAGPQSLLGKISGIGQMRRVREVRALRGFRRHDAEATLISVDLGSDQWRWPTYTAIELFGEGVFLRFDERKLAEWEAQPEVEARAGILKERRADSPWAGRLDMPEPRYIALHTLAHLLIRRLAFASGYASAALQERIYANSDRTDKTAGILIYTAAGDPRRPRQTRGPQEADPAPGGRPGRRGLLFQRPGLHRERSAGSLAAEPLGLPRLLPRERDLLRNRKPTARSTAGAGRKRCEGTLGRCSGGGPTAQLMWPLGRPMRRKVGRTEAARCGLRTHAERIWGLVTLDAAAAPGERRGWERRAILAA
jgi:hypothetical protein